MERLKEAFKGIVPTKLVEAEVSLKAVSTPEQLQALRAHLIGRNLKSSTSTQLDINYKHAENSVYRITIDQKKFDKTVQPHVKAQAKAKNHELFVQFLETKQEVMMKTRRATVDLPTMRFRISDEEKIEPEWVLENTAFTNDDDKNIRYRLKTRTSFIAVSTTTFAVRIDLTQVSSSSTISGVFNKPTYTYEVEVELIFKRNFKNLPKDSIESLYEEAEALHQQLTVPVRATAGPSVASKPKSASKSRKDPNVEISPLTWMLPNRVGFIEWFYKTFQYSDTQASSSGSMALFPSQRLVRDVLQFDSPYRGLLVYHGLGVGKTCASIAAAEGFLTNQKKIYVLLPASLTKNYQKEIMSCASIGNPQAKRWNELQLPLSSSDAKKALQHFSISVKYLNKQKGTLLVPSLPEGITDTAIKRRNLTWQNLTSTEQAKATALLEEVLNNKYQFISYNGITSKKLEELGAHAFDDAFIVIDEAHNFVSRSMSGVVGRKLYRAVMESQRSKMVLLSGTPVINHPYELCMLLNLVRGPMNIYRIKTTDVINLPPIQDITTLLKTANLWQYIDTITYGINKNIEFSLLPYNYVRNMAEDGAVIVKEKWPVKEVTDMVQKIVNEIANTVGINSPSFEIEEGTALPDTKEEFQQYFMTNPQDPRIQNENLFMRRILGLVSYYRTAGEEYFPKELPRVIKRVKMSDYQFNNYVEQRKVERKNDENQRRANAMQPQLFDKQSSVYRAFSRMSCNFVFPPNMQRPYPTELRRQLKQEIDSNPQDEPQENAVDNAVAPLDPKTADVIAVYDTKLKKELNKLYSQKEEYLTGDNLKTFSPKFAAMLKDIQQSKGSVLFYSQFRSVEGIEIFKYVLEANGFAEIKVEKKNDTWMIENAEEVLSDEFDGKRFVVFQADREKTELLLRIFNGQQVGFLPTSIQEQLKTAGYGESKNLRGDLARVMMISQSGAEGISLRNVRRVLIAEPFWNMVRIDQVIGRAIRAKSHDDLPAEDRTVEVFIYETVFSKEQIERKQQQVELDNNISTDEHIFKIAERKDRIIRQFLTMMKMAAVDCMSHAPRNKPLSTTVNIYGKEMGMKCYAFAINAPKDELSYQPSWASELARLNENPLERNRQVQGKVQRLGADRKKYVVVAGMQGVFDYEAYKAAGVLIPVPPPQ